MRPVSRHLRATLGGALLITAALPAQTAENGAARPTYTEAQATRGGEVFVRLCAECHTTVDMSGADFRVNWNTRSVLDLFTLITTTMPDNNPGGLSRGEYTDVTAYILKLNGIPAGSDPLVADSAAMSKATLPLPPPGR